MQHDGRLRAGDAGDAEGKRVPPGDQRNARRAVGVAVPQVVEASALGAAIIAAYGVGEFKSLPEASRNLVKIARTFEPSREGRETEAKFEVFLELYSRTKDLMERSEEVV
jgi:sugar (pentulose or hexulose) kinase